MNVVISQSNYIPWAGYFGLIAQADAFVFLDDVQFTSRDWRSRNSIKTFSGLKWLTIPVGDSRSRRISDVPLPDEKWKQSHKSSIVTAYKGARNFQAGMELVDALYDKSEIITLSEFNKFWTKFVATQVLGLKCVFLDSKEIQQTGKGSDRILSICSELSATRYVSGPSAQSYLKVEDFLSNNIEVKFADYSKMKQYEQMHGPFVQNVTILDMIFNVTSNYSELIEIDTFIP
jgi:hypothetical protein